MTDIGERFREGVSELTDDEVAQEFILMLTKHYTDGGREGFSSQGLSQIEGQFISSVGETARPGDESELEPARHVRMASQDELADFASRHDIPFLKMTDEIEFGYTIGMETGRHNHHIGLVGVSGPAEKAILLHDEFIDALHEATLESEFE